MMRLNCIKNRLDSYAIQARISADEMQFFEDSGFGVRPY